MLKDKGLYNYFFIQSLFPIFAPDMHKFLTFFIGLLLFGTANFAQQSHPKDYFASPMDIPLVLSGSFGELRSNHFHAGIDIKTQQVEGLNILASADGYISRIKISHWGYGKVLYVTHPNGYTTIYGHLKKFAPIIENYVRKNQYAKESFEIELQPKSKELPVKKGELIALSGNTGSSGGPHLHFEIRDAKGITLNPLMLGMPVPDHKSPLINTVAVYAKNDSSQINQSNDFIDLILKKQANGDVLANRIYAFGLIGFAIDADDKMDGAINNNGIYELEMSVNGKKIFGYNVQSVSFDESRYINNFIDYERSVKKKQKLIKCFKDPNTKLSIYKGLQNEGLLLVKDSAEYNVEITASDVEGNKTKIVVPVTGKKDSIIKFKQIKKTPRYFKANIVNEIVDTKVLAIFPKNVFYQDLYFDYIYENGIASFHNNSVALHDNFTMSFEVSEYSEAEIEKMYISRKTYNRHDYVKTYRKGNYLIAKTNNLGDYTLSSDKVQPKITPLNFKENQPLTKHTELIVKVSDSDSGVKSYRGEIDGKFILLEYDPKNNKLVYDLSDRDWDDKEHTMTITLVDNVNNSTTFTTKFYKKD